MLTPDKNFRMKATIKSSLSLMKGTDVQRASWKRAMIDAQLCEEAARRAALKSKESEGRSSGGKSRGAVAPE
jgi:hypothetical protein